MRHIGHALMIATVLALLAAIWTPYWWQALATAAVTLITGAAVLGQEKR